MTETPTTWLHSDRALARVLGKPVARFMALEVAGGIVLVVATAVALLWANSPWRHSYETLWHTTISVRIGSHGIEEDLVHWVNDGLMALFFFVVGLEIKREWVSGELRDRRAAILPAVAALGGMVVPALLYLAFNAGGAGARGWGIPMATDIAFALGVLALLGRRIPPSLKVFLLTLAIVDDIGAIVVIAVFYGKSKSWTWLAGAVVVTLAVALMRRAHVWYTPVYVAAGFLLWLCVFESGVHATIAGVIFGLLTPATPLQPELETERIVDTLENRPELTAEDVRDVSFHIRESVPVGERVEHALHPWVSFGVIPIFALANAGIRLTADPFASRAPVLLGVVVGLVVGKPVGILLSSWIVQRTGLGRLPEGVSWRQLAGAGVLAGIGFTVSLFITELAFIDKTLQVDAKMGVLVASVVAAIAGALVLVRAPSADG